jgi:hypothetical protein
MFKSVSKDGTRTFVSQFDPAIDQEAMTVEDWDAYRTAWSTSGEDWRSRLKVTQGERLTEFVVGVLGAEELNTILDETKRSDGGIRSEERFWRCFLAGLREIRGWPEEPEKENGKIKAAWLRATFVGPLRRVATSVGVAVLSYNQTTEDEIKNLSGPSKHKSASDGPHAVSATTGSVRAVGAASPA